MHTQMLRQLSIGWTASISLSQLSNGRQDLLLPTRNPRRSCDFKHFSSPVVLWKILYVMCREVHKPSEREMKRLGAHSRKNFSENYSSQLEELAKINALDLV
jgi:hypothetical protein